MKRASKPSIRMRQRRRSNLRGRCTSFGRNFEMRNHALGIALALAVILSCSSAAAPQTKQPSVAPNAPSSEQAHDLSGVWFDDHPRLITVQQRYWAYTFTMEGPPM